MFTHFTSCKVNQNQNSTENCPLISFEAGGCLNKCKNYHLTIYQTGRAIYLGKNNVTKIGKFSKSLTKDDYNNLLGFIEKNGIFELHTDFPRSEDSQSFFLEICLNDIVKKISYDPSAPKILKTLNQKLDSIADYGSWEKNK